MRRKIVTIVLTFAMMAAMLSTGGVASAKPSSNIWNTARYGDTKDIGPQLRAIDGDEEAQADIREQIIKSADEQGIGTESEAAEGETTYIGTEKIFLRYMNGGIGLTYYTLKGIGDKCEVWVANNLAYPVGDTRATPVITDEQVNKVINEFDSNIYQKDTDFFGMPDSHTGENAILPGMVGLPDDYYAPVDGTERVIILVDNIHDENYYDSTYPFFVAGFYWGTYETYMDRNIISIAARQWDTRLESTYFPTVAHEFQHLIHADNDSAEESWINEGMSDFAQYLCGYGHDMGHVNFFLDHPENSLVAWDEYYSWPTGPETLADYGEAYLFQLYLNDHFGMEFIKALAQNTNQGIDSVNEVLKEFKAGIDFEELFRRFTVALSVNNDNLPSHDMYNFKSIDVKVNYDGAVTYNKPGAPAWGADFIKLDNAKSIKDIKFDGIDFMPIPWVNMDDPLDPETAVMWGNAGDQADNQTILPVDLTNTASATLNFDTMYDIEETWDFGMVQVSEDNGQTWTSLANGDTRSDVVDEGYPAIKENLPGFTGVCDTWTTESFDLTPYAGKSILVSFRYMTDWGSNGNGVFDVPGWYIKNISIPEIGYVNSCSSLDGFESIQKVLGVYVDYMVTFVNEGITNGKSKYPGHITVKTLKPINITEEDAVEINQFLTSKNTNNYMIVWYAAPVGVMSPADYSYQIILKNSVNKNKKK